MTYIPVHLTPYTVPKHYFGATWHGFFPFLGQNRDSDCLTRSNYRVALARLKKLETPEGDGDGGASVTDTRCHHFACGWVETIYLHHSNTAALQAADAMAAALEQYPVLCEDDWSALEEEEAAACWEAASRADRVHYCQQYRVSIFAARRNEVPDDPSGELVGYLAR